MTSKSNTFVEPNYQEKYRDRLFKAIFGRNTEQSKRWRLELYNALNNTNYNDPDALEVNTIENIIYIKMHNDVSFLIDSQMNLYEHQSSPNPNMPLRGLFYFAQLYQKQLDKEDKNLLSSQLVKIPNPNFIVFYNGDTERPENYKLRLSDAFIREDKTGSFEWTATVININKNYSKTLQKNCKPLYDYVSYVSRITDNKKSGMSAKDAVNEAVDWACKNNLLEGFIRSQKEEVIAMSMTEYDEEACIRAWRRDGIAEGREEKAIEAAKNLLKMNICTVEQISQAIGLPIDQVLQLKTQICQPV